MKNHYDILSKWYDFLDYPFERFRYSRLRPVIWSYAQGKTLDLGVGTGLNMPYYPKGAEMTGIDLSHGMLEKASARAMNLRISVKLRQMDATELKFKDGTFNSIVSTFLFCVLPNDIQPQAIDEVYRVLVPGGRLILMEYVYSKKFWKRLWMKALSPWVQLVYHAGFDRRTIEFLSTDQWKIETDYFIFQDIIRLVVAQKI